MLMQLDSFISFPAQSSKTIALLAMLVGIGQDASSSRSLSHSLCWGRWDLCSRSGLKC